MYVLLCDSAATISGCVAWLRQPRVQLSMAAAVQLQALRRHIAVPFDGANSEHQVGCHRLQGVLHLFCNIHGSCQAST